MVGGQEEREASSSCVSLTTLSWSLSEAQLRQGARTYLSERATREAPATVKHAGEGLCITGSTVAERPSACVEAEVRPKGLIHFSLRAVPDCDYPQGQTESTVSEGERCSRHRGLRRWAQLGHSTTGHCLRAAPRRAKHRDIHTGPERGQQARVSLRRAGTRQETQLL